MNTLKFIHLNPQIAAAEGIAVKQFLTYVEIIERVGRIIKISNVLINAKSEYNNTQNCNKLNPVN